MDKQGKARDETAVLPCRFADKWARVQRASPHGRRAGWALRPVIVKSGDDCRQELLAAQLIAAFNDIFQALAPLSCKLDLLVGVRSRAGQSLEPVVQCGGDSSSLCCQKSCSSLHLKLSALG